MSSSKAGWLFRDWRFSQLAAFRSGFPYSVREPIGFDRLKVEPWARYTSAHQERLEKDAGATHPPDVQRIAELRDGQRHVRLHDRQRELDKCQRHIDWLRYCDEKDERRRREQPAAADGDGALLDEQPNPDLRVLDEEIERRRLPREARG